MTDIQILATGPEFVKRGLRGTQPVIEQLIKNADRFIHILAYKFGPDINMWNLLEDRLERGVKVTIVASKNEQIKPVLEKLESFEQKFKENFLMADFQNAEGGLLHAKVIVVDRKKAVIGSANFSKGGMKNHYELGVLINDESHAWELANLIEILKDSYLTSKTNR